MESISLVAAVVSAGVALWVGVLTWRQKELNRRIVKIEEAREERERMARQSADLVVRCRPGRQPSTYELKVLNQGQATAREVHVEISELPDNQIRGPDPGFVLDPGSSVAYHLLVSGQDGKTSSVVVGCEDDMGGDETETTVAFTR